MTLFRIYFVSNFHLIYCEHFPMIFYSPQPYFRWASGTPQCVWPVTHLTPPLPSDRSLFLVFGYWSSTVMYTLVGSFVHTHAWNVLYTQQDSRCIVNIQPLQINMCSWIRGLIILRPLTSPGPFWLESNYWSTAAKCYLYLESYLCANTGFLMVKLGPLGSLFRGKMLERRPSIMQTRGAIPSSLVSWTSPILNSLLLNPTALLADTWMISPESLRWQTGENSESVYRC